VMLLPHVRFTARRIMIAVAVAAVGLSVLLTFRRHAEYRRWFDAYDRDSNFIRKTIWL
jgi:predicted membrane chloride channel (bestrophin family)